MTHTDAEERQVAEQTAEELEAEHADRITEARKELYTYLHAASISITDALSAYNRLSNGDAWDVEYEGGGAFASHLNETSRLLKLTRGFMPTNADGEFVSNDQRAALNALLQGSHLA